MFKKNVWKNVAAGAAGGLIASFAMNQFQALMKVAEKKLDPKKQEEESEGGDDATVKTAEALACAATGRGLEPAQKRPAGAVVHYGYGTVVGAVYGALAAWAPIVAAGRGTAYGAAVWLGGDEIAVPALGLSESPAKTPVSGHAKALASHLVYGSVTDGVMRLLTRL